MFRLYTVLNAAAYPYMQFVISDDQFFVFSFISRSSFLATKSYKKAKGKSNSLYS